METAALARTESCIRIESDADIVVARQRVRVVAAQIGFSSPDATMLATAVSELARNILLYAKRGEIAFDVVHNGEKHGVAVIARDQGPGIADLQRALEVGFSTSGGLGLGLPGVRRLSDDFQVRSDERGTIVTIRKWRRP